jgi:hypothetical protein
MVDAPWPQPTSATLAPRVELGRNAVEGREPVGDQVGGVPGPEEALAAREHLVVVFVPADARAAAERLGDLVLRPQRAERELERAGCEDRPVRVGQREGLFGGERVGLGLRVVFHVAPGRLAAEPFVDVAGGGAGALGELMRQHRPLGERAIKTETIAHEHVARGHRRAEVSHELVQELHQLFLVDSHRFLRCAA